MLSPPQAPSAPQLLPPSPRVPVPPQGHGYPELPCAKEARVTPGNLSFLAVLFRGRRAPAAHTSVAHIQLSLFRNSCCLAGVISMWPAAPGKAGVCLRGQRTTTGMQPFNSDKSANREVSKGRRKGERDSEEGLCLGNNSTWVGTGGCSTHPCEKGRWVLAGDKAAGSSPKGSSQ